jgi:anti-anti-sigma regulatory factor
MNEAVYEVIGNELRVKLSDELDHHNASTIRATIDEMILSEKKDFVKNERRISRIKKRKE